MNQLIKNLKLIPSNERIGGKQLLIEAVFVFFNMYSNLQNRCSTMDLPCEKMYQCQQVGVTNYLVEEN